LQPKLGVADWSDDGTHSVKGNNFTFDSSHSTSLGFKYLYRLDNGFAFGDELFGYEKNYTHINGGTGQADIGQVYGLAEYYFNNDSFIKPYLGIGLGGAGIDFNGEINHVSSGKSSTIYVGIEFTINDRFAMSTEFKYFNIDIDEEHDNLKADIKSNGIAAFLGFVIKI